MTALGEWTMGLCAAGIACAVLEMLCPSGSLKRVCGVLTAVFFFCCLIGPLKSVIAECRTLLSLDTNATTAVETTLDDTAVKQVEEVLAEALTADAQERVQEQGITVKKVTAVRDTSQTDSIYIERVRVVFDKDDAPVSKETVEMLERAWGMPVEVYYADGG